MWVNGNVLDKYEKRRKIRKKNNMQDILRFWYRNSVKSKKVENSIWPDSTFYGKVSVDERSR
jgi:hypothetical protein